jgi:hypothetical protein
MSRRYQGEVLGVEPEFRSLEKRELYKRMTVLVVITWVVLAVLGAITLPYLALQVILAALFGIISLYLFAVHKRFRPMVVYQYGVEYSSGASRVFDPWGRLMWGWEDGEGLHLRRVHGIEAAMKVLDERPEVVKVVVIPRDIPTYPQVVEYILRALPEAHWAQGTKWRWDVPRGFH